MKKVRYLAGAAGVAPVLGLIMPPGNAVATVTHTPAGKGKAVSLTYQSLHQSRKAARPDNFSACTIPPKGVTSISSHGLDGFMWGLHSTSCISRVSAFLAGGHTELDMRTRFYNRNGGKVGGDHFDTAHRHLTSASNYTSWRHTDTVFAWTVCIALVTASPSHIKKYGDVCLNTHELPS